MDHKAIFKYCKELGCCDACCCRYLGARNSHPYEKTEKFSQKYQETPLSTEASNSLPDENDSPPSKRHKGEICVSCLGLLQEESWPEWIAMVKEIMDRKKYQCPNFACGISAPFAILLREKVICLLLKDAFKDYEDKVLVPVREAWKWAFSTLLATHINKTPDSGAVSPLLITLNYEYPDEAQELETLRTLLPKPFTPQHKGKHSTGEYTRRPVELALQDLTLSMMKGVTDWKEGVKGVGTKVRCESVICTHTPVYLGGRYIKLSRTLPQTPWILKGVRMMDTSVQEIIFEPIAKIYGMSAADAEHRLKFMSAGREDVDVRCLGDGRPFAVEISNPNRVLSAEECAGVCEEISNDGRVVVERLVPIDKDDLAQLKKGEETKCKTYEALCIKLSPSNTEPMINGDTPTTVTDEDIHSINTYSNSCTTDARVVIAQKTPIRVLHRRPLLTRSRKIIDLNAAKVQGHPQLFVVRVCTEAGTYVKEWVHGEAGRTRPPLGAALGPGAGADILALDVAAVHLSWPNK